MKTVFFLSHLNAGGLENYLLRFLQHHGDKINAFVVCKAGHTGIDLVKDFENLNVTIVPMKLSYFNIGGYFKLYKFLRQNSFDSVCDFSGNFAALTLLTAKFASVKKRIAFYRGSSNHFNEDTIRLVYNKILNMTIPLVATKILSNSKTAFNFFFKEKWQNNWKYKVIYNGIDASTFIVSSDNLRTELEIPNNAFVVGHVGRFNEAKNHKTIIEVAIEFCKRDKNNYFCICGKDTNIYLADIVAKNGLTEQIKLLGLRKDVYKVLNSLDCFYFPSLSEGQPNALIEALILGLPFVASNIESIRETIPIEYHGQLINPLDVSEAINKINYIKHNSVYAESLNIEDWAIRTYNAETLFKLFFREL